MRREREGVRRGDIEKRREEKRREEKRRELWRLWARLELTKQTRARHAMARQNWKLHRSTTVDGKVPASRALYVACSSEVDD